MSDPKFGVTDAKLKEVVGVALDAIISELKAPAKPEAPADPMQGGYMVLNAGSGRCGNAMSVIRLVADVWGEKQTLGGLLGGDPQTAEMIGLVMKDLKRRNQGEDWKDGDDPE